MTVTRRYVRLERGGNMHQSLYPCQLSDLKDEELLERFRQGDTPAFETLYTRYWSVLYAQAYRMLEHEQDAQDLVQEIFTSIWIKAGDIEYRYRCRLISTSPCVIVCST